MFSRVCSHLHGETNPLYSLRDAMLAEGHAITDIVSGNVTEHGLAFPPAELEGIMARSARRCSIYRPDSFGQERARGAIRDYYLEQGLDISPARILLTPGTSVAYWYCFKLLADEGDEILCPQPSYPLFDYIAALCGVRTVAYRLDEGRGWGIDLENLEAGVSTRARAIVLISPNNPTGHVATPGEVEALADIARRHSLAVISDEVFSEFLIPEGPLPRPASSAAPLVLTLNGFSKMFALPGMKLGWVAVTGDEDRVRPALRALELISDTFLPVNEMAQAAVPEIFECGRPFLRQYSGEVRARWQAVSAALAACTRCRWVPPQGGFYVTLALGEADEEEAARRLLREERILLHPGYFYDIPPHHLVMSFIQEPGATRAVLPRMLRALDRLARAEE